MITRRSATEQDDAFLFELFQAVRPAFAQLPMPPVQLDMMMRIQYAGQKLTYTTQYPGSDHDIVLMDANPAGRIWMYRPPTAHLLVDISLLPQYQNRGIGAALVTEEIARAREAGVPLRCSVDVDNPGSLRFHQRLGFRITAQEQFRYSLALET